MTAKYRFMDMLAIGRRAQLPRTSVERARRGAVLVLFIVGLVPLVGFMALPSTWAC